LDTVTARGTRHSEAGPAFRADRERPRHSFLELQPIAAAVPRARQHTKDILDEWRLQVVADTAELLVSELVTNALRASADTPVRLLLVAGYDGVLVQVWDACSRMPVVPSVPEPLDAEHGRGLLLVDALSAGYGAYRSAGVGKVVWCVVESPRLGHRAVCLRDVARPDEHPGFRGRSQP
jgi:anti-sigma regulatory factor (Ser/Thr protein kinase)